MQRKKILTVLLAKELVANCSKRIKTPKTDLDVQTWTKIEYPQARVEELRARFATYPRGL